jgi:hypothetical protein
MRSEALADGPSGVRLVLCLTTAAIGALQLVAAIVALAVGRAGLTLLLLPLVLLFTGYATHVFESSRRAARRSRSALVMECPRGS